MGRDKQIAMSLLQTAGITINGKNDYDITVHNEDVYSRVLRQGTLGLGESYMDGWWDSESPDKFFYKLLDANLDKQIPKNIPTLVRTVPAYLLNRGRKALAFNIGKKHYDIGNDVFSAMLDRRLTYSCGYWKNTNDLESAQEAKLDLVCQKIGLKDGQKILDIGSGWGSLIGYAAEKYGVKTCGLTVSKEQKKYTDEKYRGLPVKTLLQDYRDHKGKYNHVVSIGMFEHVGHRNYRKFMETVYKILKNDGLFLLHTIGGNNSTIGSDPWIDKYIFPNGMIPSIKQIGKAIEGLFVMEDWHNFSSDYDKTLMAWYDNFEKNWDKLKNKYDEKFHRMWRYYLLMCAASFRARNNQLWQIVLSKNGIRGGYQPVRL